MQKYLTIIRLDVRSFKGKGWSIYSRVKDDRSTTTLEVSCYVL